MVVNLTIISKKEPDSGRLTSKYLYLENCHSRMNPHNFSTPALSKDENERFWWYIYKPTQFKTESEKYI